MVEVLIGVGSEEAHLVNLGVGLRPPLKLHVRFSRMQLSQRLNVVPVQEKELTPPNKKDGALHVAVASAF